MLYVRFFLLLSISITLISCTEKKERTTVDKNAPVFTLIKPSQSGVIFKNTSNETANRNIINYDYFYNGAGVAIGDIDNDGFADIFFAGNDAENQLYLNNGDFNFEEIGKEAGISTKKWATGVNMVDINQDGYLDIYVCNSGPYLNDEKLANELFINNGDRTFTESAASYGIADGSYSSQAAFFDMDKDGDLDLFVMNHSLFNYGTGSMLGWENAMREMDEEQFKRSCSTLYRNDGNKKFVNISEEAGVHRPGFGLGLAITDFDENGFLDIYVANDYFMPDFLFLNNGNETFTEQVSKKASHSCYYAMGCDAADINNDGLVDLAVVDMTPKDHYRNKTLMESMNVEHFSFLVSERKYIPQYMFNTLNLNRGKGNFSEIAHLSGVAQTDWSWAVLLADLNNDGWKDYLVTNGFKRDTKDQDWIKKRNDRFDKEGATGEIGFEELQKARSTPLSNYLFQNDGNLKFIDRSIEWGFNEKTFTHGAAYGDLDNDGDLDLVMNSLESIALIYKNNTIEKGSQHYIQFELMDNGTESSVLHSRLKLFTKNEMQLIEYSFVRGYLSEMQHLAHFGLGSFNSVDSLQIFWPDGTMSTINSPAVDHKHIVDKSETRFRKAEILTSKPFFHDITAQAQGVSYMHNENIYDDFEKEILLPHRQSTLGPCISVGDVNGDGVQDFYVGGAKGQPGELYLQNLTEGLVQSSQNDFLGDKDSEDVGSLFFDADNDGDLDLYVASGGGGDFEIGSPQLFDRLYLNSGNGMFSRSKNSLPNVASSTASISSMDFDSDGDLDLFVGGRTEPGRYPEPPRSFLLENENGVFVDKTVELAPELERIGMVTSSCWLDVNKDGREDLVLVGEWMPITVFINLESGFHNATDEMGLSNTTGWWYCVQKGDMDNDGDEDLIVGNVGLNNKFHPTEDKPLHIFAKDFDNTGTLDIVLSKYYKGELTPVRGKECSSEQMPFIKEKFPMFSEFASSTLEDIYGEEELNSALHLEAKTFASIYMDNQGDGSFIKKELPIEAQLGPINNIVIWDFDKDGYLDIVVAGNMMNTEAETPSYDAGKGLFMKGLGGWRFQTSLKLDDSGIFTPQNVKGLELLMLGDERPSVVVANNNSILQFIIWAK